MELSWDLQIFYNMGGPIFRDKRHPQDEKHCGQSVRYSVYMQSAYMGIPARHNWSWSHCAKQLPNQSSVQVMPAEHYSGSYTKRPQLQVSK